LNAAIKYFIAPSPCGIQGALLDAMVGMRVSKTFKPLSPPIILRNGGRDTPKTDEIARHRRAAQPC